MLRVFEHDKISRKDLGEEAYHALQRFDEQHSLANDDCLIFDWKYREYIKVKNWVGVIKIPEVHVEILPKITRSKDPDINLSQNNLLFMLGYAENLDFVIRGNSDFDVSNRPLLEVLINLFCNELLEQLSHGVDKNYVMLEENSIFVKGKINVLKTIRGGALNYHKPTINYEVFEIDTLINRIFKRAAKKVLGITKSVTAQKKIREILIILSEVTDAHITKNDFKKLTLSRSNIRYSGLLDFSKLILFHDNPNLSDGRHSSFSILFPMEQVFEKFVAMYFKKNLRRLEINDWTLTSQNHGGNSHLLHMRNIQGGITSHLALKPDIMFRTKENKVVLILDTKWKILIGDDLHKRNGVSVPDIYQMYAYAHHFSCPNNVLLYPKMEDISDKSYQVANNRDLSILSKQIDMTFDFFRYPNRTLQVFRDIISSFIT